MAERETQSDPSQHAVRITGCPGDATSGRYHGRDSIGPLKFWLSGKRDIRASRMLGSIFSQLVLQATRRTERHSSLLKSFGVSDLDQVLERNITLEFT
ncbi:hypothetical protein HHI36_017342 [Cryptolaemus montrouzieri]|uniref:Uncharacterized protein n=1 Tax=Cryptolaemus montrouzieri TaxID=559131 RepID=A0ABD2NN00_9CUCU